MKHFIEVTGTTDAHTLGLHYASRRIHKDDLEEVFRPFEDSSLFVRCLVHIRNHLKKRESNEMNLTITYHRLVQKIWFLIGREEFIQTRWKHLGFRSHELDHRPRRFKGLGRG